MLKLQCPRCGGKGEITRRELLDDGGGACHTHAFLDECHACEGSGILELPIPEGTGAFPQWGAGSSVMEWAYNLTAMDLACLTRRELRPGVTINDGGRFLESIRADIERGPKAPRANALKDDVRQLAYRLMHPKGRND